MHLIIAHSADLIRKQGPLGFWSQQGFEASHKILKANASRSTSHGGGSIAKQAKKQIKRNVTQAFQMMAKHCRMFFSTLRAAERKISATTAADKPPLDKWVRLVRREFGESEAEINHAALVQQRDSKRVYKELQESFWRGRESLLASSSKTTPLKTHHLAQQISTPAVVVTTPSLVVAPSTTTTTTTEISTTCTDDDEEEEEEIITLRTVDYLVDFKNGLALYSKVGTKRQEYLSDIHY